MQSTMMDCDSKKSEPIDIEDGSDDSDEGYDSAGSLKDFVVEEVEEEEVAPAQPKSAVNDMDGIDTSNIISTERKVKQTQFYERRCLRAPSTAVWCWRTFPTARWRPP